ncbi:MAG: 30S ribosomal protein S12 methylthiotransferase RimO [Muribaculaceae bacterium]|nr:30S ribosomal protein S12 methylthiotransferase RimO [Muribaculaceae bacterium]
MQEKLINIISLGCSKNLVDSERLIKMMEDAGFSVKHNPKSIKRGTAVIINTCGFIGDAKEESVNVILDALRMKKLNKVSSVYVMGCLSERYRKQLPELMPEVDGWFGKFDWQGIIKTLARQAPGSTPYDRVITTGPYSAYLKIAEGCNRFCSFCAIPLITGRFKSRPMDEILAEVRSLVERGVKEFNVIAQDLSSYGTDLADGEMLLPQLIEAMAQIPGVEWIRLHYAYPAQFPFGILDVMNRYPNVCKYLDIALQHSSDKVLDNMRRHITGAETEELINAIREKVPGIHLRTTLMVGFPGEGDKEFEELKDFVKRMKFERMGAFAYCEEEDTYGAKHFKDDIPQEVKEKRLDELMTIQSEISYQLNQKKIGEIVRVLIDGTENDYYVGRTEFDSPEVDPVVYIPKKDRMLRKGRFYNVRITDATEYDLYGETVD